MLIPHFVRDDKNIQIPWLLAVGLDRGL